jgi:hypothetical protein
LALADQARRRHNVRRRAISAATTTTTNTTATDTAAVATPAALKRADSKAMFEVKRQCDVRGESSLSQSLSSALQIVTVEEPDEIEEVETIQKKKRPVTEQRKEILQKVRDSLAIKQKERQNIKQQAQLKVQQENDEIERQNIIEAAIKLKEQ